MCLRIVCHDSGYWYVYHVDGVVKKVSWRAFLRGIASGDVLLDCDSDGDDRGMLKYFLGERASWVSIGVTEAGFIELSAV